MLNSEVSEIKRIGEEEIEKLNKEVFLKDNSFEFCNLEDNDPETNLFYWCVFSNRFEIAEIFWVLGKVIVTF